MLISLNCLPLRKVFFAMNSIQTIDDYIKYFINVLLTYSPRLVSAIIVLVVGLFVIKMVTRLVNRIMVRREIEPTLANFVSDILVWGLRLLLVVTVISRLGIQTTSFVAILGAMGLAVGMSLQGSLSNFAGGMLIILFKPFRVGDTIEAQGVSGTVLEIEIFTTKLVTGNNQTIYIPNGILSNGIIVNYSQMDIRRADLEFAVSYDTNIDQAKAMIREIMQRNPKVLDQPAPDVQVKEINASAVVLAIRPWSANADFGQMSSDILQQTKDAFDRAGIAAQPYVVERSKA
jgi:small conductance mechanosensitive channel